MAGLVVSSQNWHGRVRVVVFPVEKILKAHSSCKSSKSFKSWRLMRFSLVTGVGVNLSRLESKLICSFVSCSFERFLICCLLGSTAQRNHNLDVYANLYIHV